MSTTLVEAAIAIPVWVVDLESFRRWADTDEFPDNGRVSYLNGGVWVDMSKEQVFSDNQVKQEYSRTLGNLAKGQSLGRYYPDGLRLSNIPADISNQADGTFVSRKSLQSGRARLVRGARGGYVELEGSPDMLLEVVSQSSVQKDMKLLKELYWEAGVTEYWLVDARRDPLVFVIQRHTPEGYVPVRKQAAWQKSAVFGKSFKLAVQQDELGHPEYTLLVR